MLGGGGEQKPAHLHVFASLFQGNLYRLDPVGLPTAHAQQPLALGDGDGVALDVLHAQPGKLEVLQLLRGGLRLGDGGELYLLRHQVVRLLVQPSTCRAIL